MFLLCFLERRNYLVTGSKVMRADGPVPTHIGASVKHEMNGSYQDITVIPSFFALCVLPEQVA